MTIDDDDVIPRDRLGGGMIVIDFPHYEIHSGDMFFASHKATVAAGSNLDLLITVPADVYPHAEFAVSASAECDMLLYEGPTATGGTAVTAFNRARANPHTSACSVVHTPTVSSVGTLLDSAPVNGAKIGAGASRSENEWILAPGTKYLLRAASLENACRITASMEWYE